MKRNISVRVGDFEYEFLYQESMRLDKSIAAIVRKLIHVHMSQSCELDAEGRQRAFYMLKSR